MSVLEDIQLLLKSDSLWIKLNEWSSVIVRMDHFVRMSIYQFDLNLDYYKYALFTA